MDWGGWEKGWVGLGRLVRLSRLGYYKGTPGPLLADPREKAGTKSPEPPASVPSGLHSRQRVSHAPWMISINQCRGGLDGLRVASTAGCCCCCWRPVRARACLAEYVAGIAGALLIQLQPILPGSGKSQQPPIRALSEGSCGVGILGCGERGFDRNESGVREGVHGFWSKRVVGGKLWRRGAALRSGCRRARICQQLPGKACLFPIQGATTPCQTARHTILSGGVRASVRREMGSVNELFNFLERRVATTTHTPCLASAGTPVVLANLNGSPQPKRARHARPSNGPKPATD